MKLVNPQMASTYRLDLGNTWNPYLTQCRLLAAIAFLLLSVCPRTGAADDVFAKWKRPSEFTATLGRQTVAIPPERLPNKGFPDMPIVVLKERPFTFLMVCGNETYLWSGNTLNQSIPRAQVLAPGPAGSLDNNYAGIASVFHDKPNDKLIAFYHAEDSEGIGKLPLNGVTGFYGRICVAESSTTDLRFSRLGAAITADLPKKLRAWETEGGPMEAWLAQGVGDPSVCVDADGKHLLCVYNELSNRLKAGRGVQLCLARAPIDSAGRPGSWKKNYGGSFSEPGIDGHDTPIISASPLGDTISPQLQYVEAWKRYVLVFAVGIFSEINGKPQKVVESGTYISTSHDALTWSKPVRVKTIFNIFLNGQECLMHPFLVISRATDDQITGHLMYRYTPRWPDNQGYLASTPIRIELHSMPGTVETTLEGLRSKSKSSKTNDKGQVVAFNFEDVKLTHADWVELGNVESLRTLTIPKTGISDAEMKHLSRLSQLRSLGMWQTSITNDGVKYVGELSELTYFSVEGNRKITDEGIFHLTGLRKLTWLGLSYTGVADSGMKHVSKLSSLNRLELNHTAISDQGLDDIAKIKTLTILGLKGTKVTDAGVAKLQRQLPNCQVNR